VSSTFAAFWGKARGARSGEPASHPLWMHSLDVAAVGRELADVRPLPLARVSRQLGWSAHAFRELWIFLLALHDIGKFSEHFQAKVDDFWPAAVLGGRETFRGGGDPGHPAAGDVLLFGHRSRRPDLISPLLQAWFPDWGSEDNTVRALFAPILGHHGRPVCGEKLLVQDLFGEAAETAALAFAEAIHALLCPPVLLPEPKTSVLRRATWLLAGLTTIADWVGSNRDWFPYQDNGPSIAAYWEGGRSQARRALAEAGLIPAPPAQVIGFGALTGISHAASPVQAWAASVQLPEGPLLILVEDMTGGGKTEAAIMLAHRLMAAGRATGIYFALPTMATANAMFARVDDITERLYAPGACATLTLAHGRAHLHPRFRDLTLAGNTPDARDATDSPDNDQEDSALTAPQWLLSESRKALLADLGVGTIDQALLGVLPAKYQGLRLAGLAEKVLIVDEAHAYDSYMGRELEQLVAFQAALGGNTIVLSATLPKSIKVRLAIAWSKALLAAAPRLVSNAYPCVTLLAPGQERTVEEKKAPRPDLPRILQVARLPGADAVVERVVKATQAGAAVAWVRNTVDDVIAGAALLRAQGLDAQIFHARYAMGDRLAIETDVVTRFGKDGTQAGRRGRVLVASQVIEQSLDCDFDLMVSDLAPVDLLLQRAGRLWRHTWRTRPLAGPTLLVVSPDPADVRDGDWYRDAFPLAASVYDHPLVLWRSAHELFTRGAIRITENVRALIEAVYGPDLEKGAPEVFERSSNQASGRASAERSFADHNLLKVESGYTLNGTPWGNEEKVATRLSEESRRLRLAVEEGGVLRPWCHDADSDPHMAWALSELTVRERKLKGAYKPLPRYRRAAEEARATWGKFEDDVILLPLTPIGDGNWTGTLVAADGAELALGYSRIKGLLFD
jgi:CRISPR-associated endonuclease/helicase Cas3